MTPQFVLDSVAAFGRQMGFKSFALGENGAAGIRFENGVSFRLEYFDGALTMRAALFVGDDVTLVKKALMSAHPSAQRGPKVRAVLFSKTGEIAFVMRLPERSATATAISDAFRRVWVEADRLRKAVAA